jgi:hypothetical protein
MRDSPIPWTQWYERVVKPNEAPEICAGRLLWDMSKNIIFNSATQVVSSLSAENQIARRLPGPDYKRYLFVLQYRRQRRKTKFRWKVDGKVQS